MNMMVLRVETGVLITNGSCADDVGGAGILTCEGVLMVMMETNQEHNQ